VTGRHFHGPEYRPSVVDHARDEDAANVSHQSVVAIVHVHAGLASPNSRFMIDAPAAQGSSRLLSLKSLQPNRQQSQHGLSPALICPEDAVSTTLSQHKALPCCASSSQWRVMRLYSVVPTRFAGMHRVCTAPLISITVTLCATTC
jgi:hypothetical protein